MSRDELAQRIDAIEESYEFFLAYAAQGLKSDQGSELSGQLRQFLRGTAHALDGLADGVATLVERGGLKPTDPYRDLVRILERDAANARAAVLVVEARDEISSQLIDNLNAFSHLRALLTDLFLLDELLKEAPSG